MLRDDAYDSIHEGGTVAIIIDIARYGSREVMSLVAALKRGWVIMYAVGTAVAYAVAVYFCMDVRFLFSWKGISIVVFFTLVSTFVTAWLSRVDHPDICEETEDDDSNITP